MLKVIVASKNTVKLSAAQLGFEKMFPGQPREFLGVSVPSGVADQPMTDEETLQGAKNRLRAARESQPDADFWVGIEGGCASHQGKLLAFAWVAAEGREGLVGQGRTGSFYLPPKVAEFVLSGVELGVADDLVFGRVNSKEQNGAVGLLTGNAIDRAKLYSDAVSLALIPFKNVDLYSGVVRSC